MTLTDVFQNTMLILLGVVSIVQCVVLIWLVGKAK